MEKAYQKLYMLSYVESEDEVYKSLSYSHDIEKLQRSVYTNSPWYILGQTESAHCRTEPGQYPMYQIEEVNFII